MAGRAAVRIGDTLFRVEEISWVKVGRLNRWELLAKGLLIGSGLLFVLLVCYAKGTIWNPEFVLGFLPVSLGASIRGHYRVASSGDDEESYLDRNAQGQARPADLAEEMRGVGIGTLEYSSPENDYYYVLRPERIAWVRPWYNVDFQPLWTVALFAAYFVVAPRGPFLAEVPILKDLMLLDFPAHGSGPAQLATALVILGGCMAIGASFKRGVELAAVGGVRDTMPLCADHRGRIFSDLAVAERAQAASNGGAAPEQATQS